MVHPLGRHWRQPPHDAVLIDEKDALMSKEIFDQLSEYSSTVPTGVYEGKMWRGYLRKPGSKSHGWFLLFYSASDKPEMCSIQIRHILPFI